MGRRKDSISCSRSHRRQARWSMGLRRMLATAEMALRTIHYRCGYRQEQGGRSRGRGAEKELMKRSRYSIARFCGSDRTVVSGGRHRAIERSTQCALLLVLVGMPPTATGEGTTFKTIEFVGGAVYRGHAENGKPDGRGKMLYPNGARYEGSWVNGGKHGHGTYKWPSGKAYEGEWHKGRMHGIGTLKWPNEAEYKGEFRHGKPHGAGEYVTAGNYRYKGQARNGCFTGKGSRLVKRIALLTTARACGFK